MQIFIFWWEINVIQWCWPNLQIVNRNKKKFQRLNSSDHFIWKFIIVILKTGYTLNSSLSDTLTYDDTMMYLCFCDSCKYIQSISRMCGCKLYLQDWDTKSSRFTSWHVIGFGVDLLNFSYCSYIRDILVLFMSDDKLIVGQCFSTQMSPLAMFWRSHLSADCVSVFYLFVYLVLVTFCDKWASEVRTLGTRWRRRHC